MFYFQQLLTQALNGIDQTNLMSGITGISYAILLLSFLIGMYQAVLRGGDFRMLVTAGLKYLVVGIILANWGGIFRQVNNSANAVAQSIASSAGAGDTFTVWLQQFQQQYSATGNQKLTDLVTETAASFVTVLFLFSACVIFPCSMLIFSFFYALYGVLLYVVGPLVVALLPMGGMGQMAKSFSVNLLIWNFWGILYAILCALITVIHADQMNSILNQHGFLGFFQGLGNSTLLGLISIFYALALAMIPFLAKRVVGGEVGETMVTFIRAATTAAGLAMAGGMGWSAGIPATGAEAGGGAGGSSSGGKATGGASSSAPKEAAGLDKVTQSGGASATGQSSAPLDSGVGGGKQKSDKGKESKKGSGGAGSSNSGSSSSATSYRPQGAAQFLAYHAGKAAASGVHSVAQKFDSEESKSGTNGKK